MKPVKLSALIEALEYESPETVTRVDLQNGCVVIVDRSFLSAAEEGDAEPLKDAPNWQKAEMETARAIAAEAGKRFVAGPDKFDFHEYRQMERFIGTVETPEVAEQLWRAIKAGKGAFRYFKDTASRLGLLDRWFAYRDQAMNDYVRDWAEVHQIAIEDDSQPRPQKRRSVHAGANAGKDQQP